MQLDEKHLSFLNQGQTSDFIQFRLEFKLEFERLVSSITRLKTLETRILRISSRDINPYKLNNDWKIPLSDDFETKDG